MAKKKIQIIETNAQTAITLNTKEDFAYRFGYTVVADELKAFKNRAISSIARLVGNDQYSIQRYSAIICRIVGIHYVRDMEFSFSSSWLFEVLKALQIENTNLYVWLQILEIIANAGYTLEDNPKQYWFAQEVAEALKLSGINAVLCYTENGYKFFPSSEKFLDKKLVIDVLNWLDKFPNAKEQYQQALNYILKGQSDRQAIDCLRLSLELFMKGFFANDKSLENQKDPLGKYLKGENISGEIRNMYMTLVDYYSKYNNEHAKHDDSVNENEVDFLVYLTGSFIRFLIRESNKM